MPLIDILYFNTVVLSVLFKNCHTVILFIFISLELFGSQACQGDKLDGGVRLQPRTEVDGDVGYTIPIHADFLIAYSTIPGICKLFLCHNSLSM